MPNLNFISFHILLTFPSKLGYSLTAFSAVTHTLTLGPALPTVALCLLSHCFLPSCPNPKPHCSLVPLSSSPFLPSHLVSTLRDWSVWKSNLKSLQLLPFYLSCFHLTIITFPGFEILSLQPSSVLSLHANFSFGEHFTSTNHTWGDINIGKHWSPITGTRYCSSAHINSLTPPNNPKR